MSDMVTFSMGIGTTVPEPQEELSEFLELIDRRLYQAKANGRDRTEAGAA